MVRRGAAIVVLSVVLLAACGGGGGTDVGGVDGNDAADAPEAGEVADAADVADAVDVPDAADLPEAGDLPATPDPIPGDVSPEALVLPPEDPGPAVEWPAGIPVRVVTLNVYGFRFATPEAIGAYLQALDPDLAMLEECGADVAAQVAAAAGMPYHATGAGGEAILSRTALADVSEIPLVEGRGLLHATTVLGGVNFSVYAAHISWHVAGNLQARQIAREVLPSDPLPHLVMAGDFNDEHYSTQNAYLEEVLADAATAAGWYPGQHITWPSTGFDETEGAQTIDLVFFRKALPALVTALDAANLSPVLSDHKPVVGDLLYPAGEVPFATDPLAATRDPFAGFPPEGDRPPNLLRNPGAEDGLAGWETGGGVQALATRLHLSPRAGTGLFTGYDAPTDLEAPWSRASQAVDLSDRAAAIDAGRGRLYAAAWLASGYLTIEADGEVSNRLTTYSDGEVVVETLDGAGAVLSRTESGRRDTLAWHPFAAIVDVPPGARAARVTWIAHHKSQGGDADGAAFDDLYLGFEEAASAHRVRGGALVPGGGGEPGDDGVQVPAGWATMRDGQVVGPWGIALFPPYCASGTGCFLAHPRTDPDADPVAGPAALSREVDLAPFAAEVDAGRLALRWGAWLRTFSALTSVRLALVIVDADGSPWATFETPSLSAAEWTRVAGRTRMPPNARRVRIEVRAPLDREDDTVFADEITLVPEVAPVVP